MSSTTNTEGPYVKFRESESSTSIDDNDWKVTEPVYEHVDLWAHARELGYLDDR